MEQYNLDFTMVGNSADPSNVREKGFSFGGKYDFQQAIWSAVAELNFCVYRCRVVIEETPKRRRLSDGSLGEQYMKRARRSRHTLVGRRINVMATKQIAGYIEAAVERMAMEFVSDDNKQRWSNHAVSFRKGATAEIVGRIYERRRELLNKEAEEANARREQAAASSREGATDSRALTLTSITESEDEANYDFINGAGAWAHKKAVQAKYEAKWAAEEAEKEAKYTKWAAANPEKARKAEEKARLKEEEAEARRRQSARRSWFKDNTDPSAYNAGYKAGAKVGLDPQMETKTAGRLK